MVELRQLQYLVTLAEELSFSRAAARESITTSGFSQQIRRLEVELGVQLVHRTSRKVELSTAGTALVEEARVLLERAARLRALADELRDGLSGSLRVGYTSQGGGGLLAAAIAELRRRAPAVSVVVVELDFLGHFSAISEGRVDVQFVRLPVGDDAALAVRPIGSEPRCLAVPTSHPWVGRHDTVTASEVASCSVLSLPPMVPEAFDRYFRAGSNAPRGPVVHTVTESLAHVAAGYGVVLVPRSLTMFFQHPGVAYLDADVPWSTLAIGHHASRSDPRVDAFVEITAALAGGPGDREGLLHGVETDSSLIPSPPSH